MCRVIKLEIRETQDELAQLLKQQKTGLGKQRVQTLYLLKTRQVETVQHLAVVLGRSGITVHRWLKLYRQGGLNSLLEQKKSPGRPKTIRLDVRLRGAQTPRGVSLIKKQLCDPQGFKSYEEVQTWLLASEGIKASYKVVHEVVRYKLKAKLKAALPRSIKQHKGIEQDFKKNFRHG